MLIYQAIVNKSNKKQKFILITLNGILFYTLDYEGLEARDGWSLSLVPFSNSSRVLNYVHSIL